jgi:pilus assembly protein CpaB
MWKVKRMNTARIVVLTIAVGAGGIAGCPASGSDNKPLPTEPVADLQTVDVRVAKADIGLGDATTRVAGSIARAPFIAGEPIREPKPVGADGSGLMAAILPAGIPSSTTTQK